MAYSFYYSELMHDLYKQFLDPPSKIFKKVNLCLKKKRKKKLVCFHCHHQAFCPKLSPELWLVEIENLGPRESARKLGLELKQNGGLDGGFCGCVCFGDEDSVQVVQISSWLGKTFDLMLCFCSEKLLLWNFRSFSVKLKGILRAQILSAGWSTSLIVL